MPAMQHVYLTAHGSWSSGPWVGEAAQIGLRLCFAPVASAPVKGAIFTPLGNGDADMDQGTLAGTNGTLTRTWIARVGPAGSTFDHGATQQVDFAEDLRTFLDAIKGNVSSAFRWTHIKQAAVAADGSTIQPSSVYTFTSPLAGTGSNTLPPQVAMAISMRADIIGRRGRGRIYLPALSTGLLASDGTIAATPANTLRSSFVTLVNNLQNVSGWSTYMPIVSILSAGSADAVRPSQVRTGNRFDTIQSRRRQVAEAYATTPL